MPLTVPEEWKTWSLPERQAFLKYLQGKQQTEVRRSSVDAYLYDPVKFIEECITWPGNPDGTPGGLTAYQKEILSKLPGEKRVSARGPHGLGKSTLAAVTVLWFALTRDAAEIDFKCVTTAGAWRQLEKYLWPEIHKWARHLNWERLGRGGFDPRTELLALTLKLKHGSAFAVASDTPELIEGAHADSVLYVFDESKSIITRTFEAAEGAFSGARKTGLPEAFALAISTPGEPNGMFYDIQRRAEGLEEWWVRHVTLQEAMAANRISEDWREKRARQWGENSAVYQNRVLGEFSSSDEDGVIPLSWVEAAINRWLEWRDKPFEPEGMHTLGVDVARGGTDKTVVAIRLGNVITELRRTHKEDTMQTSGRVRALLLKDPTSTAVVDVIGIGAGVVDRLREQHLPVQPFNAAQGTRRKDGTGELGFVNCRSAGWWNLREYLDPTNGHNVCLPDDKELIGDLTAPHWKVMSGGKIQVEAKDDIRKRINRSTDAGDAVVQAFWPNSEDWDEVYGLVYHECGKVFMKEIHPTRCPKCHKEHGE